jgi:hypothetical protein
MATVLIVRRGSGGGSTSPTGSLPVKGIHRGGERSADADHGATRLAVAALLAVMSTSEVVSTVQI